MIEKPRKWHWAARGHWMDCSLFLGPAYRPERCDCGGHPAAKWWHPLRNIIQLWRMRYLFDRGML